MMDEFTFTSRVQIEKEVSFRYLLHVPKMQGEESTKEYPLVLFLHGMGERGNDLSLLKTHGLPKLAESQDLPFIMLAPQCPDDIFKYHTWVCFIDELKVLIDDVLERYPVDQNRIYITGLSMGGYGVWEMIQRFPNLFAAAIPICGGGSVERLDLVKDLPIWAFHGIEDEVIPIIETERLIARLRELGSNVRFTKYKGIGHDSWTTTYNNPEVLSWLLEQEKEY